MAKPTCSNCDRSADAGAYCSSWAAAPMASAPDPFHGGRRKKPPRRQENLPPGPSATSSNPSTQHPLFR